MTRAALLAVATAALVAGCGNPGGDLIAIEVREPEPGTPIQRLVVTDDGRGSCSGGELERLESGRLLETREVERELKEHLERDASFQPTRPGRAVYRAESRDGTVTWTEGATPAPVAVAKATALALKLRRELCG